MITLITTVFVASLCGSLHCAGMCGPFVAFAVGTGSIGAAQRGAGRAWLHGAYHSGRLLTYSLLGAAAGALGAALDFGGAMVGLQRTAAVLAGAMMVGFGLLACARLAGARVGELPLPGALRTVVSRGHLAAMRLGPVQRAGIIGALTTLLPCGWLYAFALTAAGTASPLLGAATMVVFWAGTVPVLASLGLGVQLLAGRLRGGVAWAASVAIVIVGTLTVVNRAQLPSFAGRAAPSSLRESVTQVSSLNSEEMPCCKDER
ncbi:MAG: sulfite exporter TauE/SafE family protein [Phycisphaerales bacterium]|nr:sulfite exporter TauE/SafE family protein [Phycisphaerales bacterium]